MSFVVIRTAVFGLVAGAILGLAASTGRASQSGLDPTAPQWCDSEEVLEAVAQATGQDTSFPDLLVDLEPWPVCESVDAELIGTDQPATCSVQAALNWINTHGDPTPDDGRILIGVRGEARATAGRFRIENTGAMSLVIAGCNAAIIGDDADLPGIHILMTSSPVAVIGFEVSGLAETGILVEGSQATIDFRALSVSGANIGVSIQNASGDVAVDSLFVAGTTRTAIEVLTNDGSDTSLALSNSEVTGCREYGLRFVVSGGSVLEGNISETTIRDCDGTGLAIELGGASNESTAAAAADIQVIGNRIEASPGFQGFGGGIRFISGAQSRLEFGVFDNIISGVHGDLIEVVGSGDVVGRIGAKGAGNDLAHSRAGDGVSIDMDEAGGSATWTLTIEGNSIGREGSTAVGENSTRIGDDGIQIRHRDGSGQLDVFIVDNYIASAASEGIRFFSDEDLSGGADHPSTTLLIHDNRFSRLGTEEAVLLRLRDTAKVCLSASGNLTNERKALVLDLADSSHLTVAQASSDALEQSNEHLLVTANGDIEFGSRCPTTSRPGPAVQDLDG